MKLLTKELEKKFPNIGDTDNQGENTKIIAKFFTPWAGWTWYATEYDPIKRLFFGLVEGLEREFGYFSLDELEAINGPFGLKIERDLYFGNDKTLKDV